MGTISKRELNQNTAGVLENVTDSSDVVVTERGVPRWRILRYRADDFALSRLEREGRYTPPSADPAPWPEDDGGRSYTDADVDALLDDIKGDH